MKIQTFAGSQSNRTFKLTMRIFFLVQMLRHLSSAAGRACAVLLRQLPWGLACTVLLRHLPWGLACVPVSGESCC